MLGFTSHDGRPRTKREKDRSAEAEMKRKMTERNLDGSPGGLGAHGAGAGPSWFTYLLVHSESDADCHGWKSAEETEWRGL